jgi:hypothetical protein
MNQSDMAIDDFIKLSYPFLVKTYQQALVDKDIAKADNLVSLINFADWYLNCNA